MTRLFLENKEVDLGENFSCPITKTFEDIQNPTSIINDYSKTITIPHTQNNDRLFGFLFNPDRLTAREGTTLTGIYFDPYQKIAFRLEYNDSVLMTGYLKVLTVSSKGYECSLNGELGKIIQELQKITIIPSINNKYYYNTDKYYKEILNKELIKKSFTTASNFLYDLKEKTETGYECTDFMTFIMNPYWNNNMDTESVFNLSLNKSIEIKDLLLTFNPDIESKTGLNASDIVKLVTPLTFRSLLAQTQIGCIPINNLFLILKNAAKDLLNIDIDLSDKFFSEKNLSYAKCCMLLNTVQSNGSFSFDEQTFNFTSNEEPYNVKIYPSSDDIIYLKAVPDYSNLPTIPIIETYTITGIDINDVNNIEINGVQNNIEIIYKFTGGATGSHSSYDSFFLIPNYSITEKKYDPVKKTLMFNLVYLIDYENEIGGRMKAFHSDRILLGYYMNIKNTIGNNITIKENGNLLNWDKGNLLSALSKYTSTNLLTTTPEVSLYTFWDNRYTLFDVILSFCKMFKLLFIYKNNSLKIMPAQTYFSKYTTVDFSNKIDKTKDYIIQPVSFDKKYINFVADNENAYINTEYKKAYGVSYGAKKLITNYNFNDETKTFNFFPLKIGVTEQLTYITLTNLVNNNISYTSNPGEVNISSCDKNNNYTSSFGIIGQINYGTEIFENIKIAEMPETWLSSIAILPIDGEDIRAVNTFTSFINNDFAYYFNAPEKLFFKTDAISGITNNIYDKYWGNYITERYNTQNKIVTCYLKLTPTDYANFEFNKFLLIDNQLYVVNKIYDYDITNNDSTKVDLITIQNIDGYCK